MPCVGVTENMRGFVCPHCGERTDVSRSGGGEVMAERMGVPFLGRLPLAREAVVLCDEGAPLLGAGALASLREAFETIARRLVPE